VELVENQKCQLLLTFSCYSGGIGGLGNHHLGGFDKTYPIILDSIGDFIQSVGPDVLEQQEERIKAVRNTLDCI
jgi:hypothetical protein